jgi:hypothetical protein
LEESEFGVLRFHTTCQEAIVRLEQVVVSQRALDDFVRNTQRIVQASTKASPSLQRVFKGLRKSLDPVRKMGKILRRLMRLDKHLERMRLRMYEVGEKQVGKQRQVLHKIERDVKEREQMGLRVPATVVGRSKRVDLEASAHALAVLGGSLDRHGLFALRDDVKKLLKSSDDAVRGLGRVLESQVGQLSESSMVVEAAGDALRKRGDAVSILFSV